MNCNKKKEKKNTKIFKKNLLFFQCKHNQS